MPHILLVERRHQLWFCPYTPDLHDDIDYYGAALLLVDEFPKMINHVRFTKNYQLCSFLTIAGTLVNSPVECDEDDWRFVPVASSAQTRELHVQRVVPPASTKTCVSVPNVSGSIEFSTPLQHSGSSIVTTNTDVSPPLIVSCAPSLQFGTFLVTTATDTPLQTSVVSSGLPLVGNATIESASEFCNAIQNPTLRTEDNSVTIKQPEISTSPPTLPISQPQPQSDTLPSGITMSATMVLSGSVLPKLLVVVCLETIAPIHATASIERTCTRVNMDDDLTCTSGSVHIGSTSRAGVRYILDTKLWVVFSEHELAPTLSDVVPFSRGSTLSITNIPVTKRQNRKRKMLLIAELLYLIGTDIGSLSYIQLADVNSGSDFWWATFNSTGTLTFIVNWFDKYRALTSQLPNAQLDSLMFADAADYSKDNTVVTYSALYASMIQFDVANDIAIAIRGLRQSLLLWIATHTLQRQQRCQKYQTNGVVYLEAPLRNVDWTEFESCWGTSFDIAIAKDFQGSSWLSSVKSNSKSVAEEFTHWLKYNITKYTVEWQNYKTIGLVDTFSIENVFGFTYPINLQTTNESFRFDQESSMKLN
ncbi:hypothetical protein THRCLA_23384 [Thraustotheca clavata]|uniref:Uncharacterized protein n=1 Tax=Thraustotheca clavata TaxID=74557 RepID=A0A1V9Y6N5_9STRA|nr:hypothetical protein THRCLA_23384 [Thraustotheca clavata]